MAYRVPCARVNIIFTLFRLAGSRIAPRRIPSRHREHIGECVCIVRIHLHTDISVRTNPGLLSTEPQPLKAFPWRIPFQCQSLFRTNHYITFDNRIESGLVRCKKPLFSFFLAVIRGHKVRQFYIYTLQLLSNGVGILSLHIFSVVCGGMA